MDPIRRAISRDDRRLTALLEAARRHLAAGELAAADQALSAFARRLRRHIRVGDQVFFPAIEHRLGTTDTTVTTAMRREHEVLLTLLGEIDAPGRAGLDATLLEMEAALRLHLRAEESALHPILDSLLSITTIRDMVEMVDEPAA
jgi:iron-sulfur cluster repair protein YtfE (RIC family)